MIKFWSDDFEYIKRFGACEPYSYLFKVRSDSANYLINKYQLPLPIILIYYHTDKTIYVCSSQYKNQINTSYECNADDVEELYNILKPIMDVDMQNYEEYCCDPWYGKDDRWE